MKKPPISYFPYKKESPFKKLQSSLLWTIPAGSENSVNPGCSERGLRLKSVELLTQGHGAIYLVARHQTHELEALYKTSSPMGI